MAQMRSAAVKLKGGVAGPLDMLGKTALKEMSFRAFRFAIPTCIKSLCTLAVHSSFVSVRKSPVKRNVASEVESLLAVNPSVWPESGMASRPSTTRWPEENACAIGRRVLRARPSLPVTSRRSLLGRRPRAGAQLPARTRRRCQLGGLRQARGCVELGAVWRHVGRPGSR